MSSNIKDYGVTRYHYESSSDKVPNCPGCYSQNIRVNGAVYVDGNPQNSYTCNGCNRLFSKLTGSVQSLLSEVQEHNPNSIVTYTATDNVTCSTINAASVNTEAQIKFDTREIQYKIDETNTNLQTLIMEIRSLRDNVEGIALKNNELMDKLSTDPLSNMRKLVNEFNLK